MPRFRRLGLLGAGALALCLAACLEDPTYTCSGDDVCVINGVQGNCDLGTRTCVYQGPECMSGYRNGRGECVVPSMPITTTTDATTTSDADSNSSGTDVDTGAATWVSTGPEVECGSGTDDITVDGSVSADSVNPEFPAGLAVDGDLGTSWFSESGTAGPSTAFAWRLLGQRCIMGVEIDGNGLNEVVDVREGRGFDSVIIRVLDPSDELVFEETRQLPGTPDPHVAVSTGGVVGSRIVLVFSGHEDPAGGGFAELKVLGQ